MKIVCVNSMEKIFPDIEPSLTLRRASVFGNERYNFQFAVCSEKDVAATFSLSVNGREIPAKLVKSMPSQLSKYLNVSDDFVIFKERASTFYPDLLLPVPDKKIYLKKDCWTSIWGTVNGAELSAGENHISISVCEDGRGIEHVNELCVLFIVKIEYTSIEDHILGCLTGHLQNEVRA